MFKITKLNELKTFRFGSTILRALIHQDAQRT